MQKLGCNTGLEVIPFNGTSYNGQPIHIVFWSGDKQCGIFRNQFNFTGKQCIGNNKFGNVIEYSPQDINCELPLDSWTPLLGLALVFIILKNRKWKSLPEQLKIL